MTNPYHSFAEAYKELSQVKLLSDRENPFFKSRYATINAYFDLIKPILLKHGLILTGERLTSFSCSLLRVAVKIRTFEGECVTSTEYVIDTTGLELVDLCSLMTSNFRYAMRDLFALPTEVDNDAPEPVRSPKVKFTTGTRNVSK